MGEKLIKQAVPKAVLREIRQHIRKGSAHAEEGWQNAPTSEDALTGDWGSALRSSWSQQIEDSGFYWRWRIQYRKLGGGNQYSSEEQPTGADGVFQIEVERFVVSVLPASDTTVSLENVESNYSFHKGVLFQAKRHDTSDRKKLIEELTKIEDLTPGNGVFFEYGPGKYRAALAQKVIEANGVTGNLDPNDFSRLGDFLAGQFLECLVGVEGLYVDLDSEPQILHLPDGNGAVQQHPVRLSHALNVQVSAFKMVRFASE